MCFRAMADSQNPRTALAEREIRTATGDSETLLLTPVGENLFRVEESSFVTDAVYRDVIRVTETQDCALLFVEIAERWPRVTNSWILSQELIQSDAVQAVLKTDHGAGRQLGTSLRRRTHRTHLTGNGQGSRRAHASHCG